MPNASSIPPPPKSPTRFSGGTGLSPLLARDLADKLQHLMETEQPYLHPDLRLEDLAGRLGVSRNQASQVINEHFNRSFFDFINEDLS